MLAANPPRKAPGDPVAGSLRLPATSRFGANGWRPAGGGKVQNWL